MSSDREIGFRSLRGDVEASALEVAEALVVDPFLDAGDALIVGVGEAQHVGADRAVRVDALVLRQEADARQAQPEHLLLLLVGDAALDPDEALLRAQPLAEVGGVDVGEHRGEQLDGLVLVDEAAWLGEDRHGLDVLCQHAAVPVEKFGPGARNRVRRRGLEPRRRFLGEAELDQLAIDEAVDAEEPQGDQAQAEAALVEPRRAYVPDEAAQAGDAARCGSPRLVVRVGVWEAGHAGAISRKTGSRRSRWRACRWGSRSAPRARANRACGRSSPPWAADPADPWPARSGRATVSGG